MVIYVFVLLAAKFWDRRITSLNLSLLKVYMEYSSTSRLIDCIKLCCWTWHRWQSSMDGLAPRKIDRRPAEFLRGLLTCCTNKCCIALK